MAAVIQVKRRLGVISIPVAGALADGELAYNDETGTPAGAQNLYVGSGGAVRTLISSTRQVEVAGAQTITGAKTIDVANLKVTGGASGQLMSTDGAGNLAFIPTPVTVVPSNINPLIDGTAAPGTALPYARE